ncbi:MAG: hypothetical protein E7324_01030 [Clostridiales bacterium]|nr:hypothetical protein [Clostridiales bacterium]
MPMPGILEIDLHGKNAYQARITLDSTLKKADASVYRIRVIHGFHQGEVLKEVTAEYARHPRVKGLKAIHSGCTDLILREK